MSDETSNAASALADASKAILDVARDAGDSGATVEDFEKVVHDVRPVEVLVEVLTFTGKMSCRDGRYYFLEDI